MAALEKITAQIRHYRAERIRAWENENNAYYNYLEGLIAGLEISEYYIKEEVDEQSDKEHSSTRS